jgi:putative transposase
MNSAAPTYKNHRFPIEVVARAIWLYFRFNVSLREVEEMMLERGVAVSHETIRRWCSSHGPMITARLHRKSPSSSDVWHLDEAVVRIGGRKCWLWRAVDQDGYVLDEIVQVRRNTKAAKRLLVRLLKKQGLAPKRIITDKLRSYGAARRQVMPAVEHRSHKGLNNRAENSHLPFRKRERTRQGFRSIGSLQQFVSIFSAVRNHFVPAKSNRPAAQNRSFRQAAATQWRMAALQLA